MFVYLRYFYAASLVLVIVGGIAVGSMIRSMTAEGLGLLIKEHDSALAQQYTVNVWERYYPKGSGSSRFDTMGTFRAESKKFVHDIPKLRFSLLKPDGSIAFRSNNDAFLDKDAQDINQFRQHEAVGKSALSRIVEHVEQRGESSDIIQRSIVQSLIPIHNPRYYPTSKLCEGPFPTGTVKPDICVPSLGIIEIVSDISVQWSQLETIQLIATASIIGIFLALISILFFTTRRAEGIIAKQHEVNLGLTAAAATAEAENRDKSQFLANISHELRTPLNAIIGFSEIIKNEAMTNLNQTHQEYISDIHGSGKHLLSLINDILDYSKAEAGKLEIDVSELDLSKLIINSMRLVIPRAEEAQVTLVEDMPPEHIICRTDAKKLKQVILNLLSNAVKFTPAGGEVRVAAWEKLLDGKVCIQVKDTGIGIAPKDIAKVMSPFGQVDSKLSRRYEGTGLGLPLSKKFVEIMGGTFEIESQVDVGTTITISLPGNKEQAQAAEQVATRAPDAPKTQPTAPSAEPAPSEPAAPGQPPRTIDL